MKNIVRILAIVGFVLLIACGQNQTNIKKDYAIVTVVNKNKAIKDTFYINAGKPGEWITMVPDVNSIYKDTIALEEATIREYYYLEAHDQIYLEPGFDITITCEKNDKIANNLRFDGEGSTMLNYLDKKYDIDEKTNAQYFDKSEDEVFMKNDALAFIAKIQEKMEANLNSATDLPESFITREKELLKYENLNNLKSYYIDMAYINENFTDYYPKDFIQTMEAIDWPSDPIYRLSFSAAEVSYGKVELMALRELKKDSTQDWYTLILDKAKNAPSDFIQADIAKNNILKAMENQGNTAEKMKAYMNQFKTFNTSKEDSLEVALKYDLVNKTLPGNPSPKFVDYENYAGGTLSLEDLKGKYVYIDLWATWCGPCIAEIPALKKLEKQYHGKNIEFVSISVDTKRAYKKWKKMVKDKELTGIQLIAEDAFESEFVDAYGVDGIPRFLLIGPEGEIVDGNTLRPSNPDITEYFDTLGI